LRTSPESWSRGGYEGIQSHSDSALWIVEDVGGRTGTINTHARQPNSFIYRFVPDRKSDLRAGGKLQVLAVRSLAHAGDILFERIGLSPLHHACEPNEHDPGA